MTLETLKHLRTGPTSARSVGTGPGTSLHVPKMQVHRPGALDYQSIPSNVNGKEVPFKSAIALTSKVAPNACFHDA